MINTEGRLSLAEGRIIRLEQDVRHLKTWLGLTCAWIGAAQAMVIVFLLLR